MKLLLTSGGITNQSIAKALFELVGKKPEETTIVFIPTAANVARGDMGWFAKNIYEIYSLGLKFFDVADISAVPQNIWLPKLEAADVLFFSGGNTPHLVRWLNESGLKDLLPELLKTRVYAGISAGSIAASKTLELSGSAKSGYYKEKFGYETNEGLGYVDFFVRPHLNKPGKEGWSNEVLEEMVKKISPIYAIDDQSALKVVDGKVEVISEGKYLILNK